MNAHRALPAIFALTCLAMPAVALAQETSAGSRLHLDQLVIDIRNVDVDTDSARFEEYRDMSPGFAFASST